MFDADAFSRMREGAWFVNVGRGAVCDEQALIATGMPQTQADELTRFFEELEMERLRLQDRSAREDWERDYRTASEDGNNIFRHWFLWSAIEATRYWALLRRRRTLGLADPIVTPW